MSTTTSGSKSNYAAGNATYGLYCIAWILLAAFQFTYGDQMPMTSLEAKQRNWGEYAAMFGESLYIPIAVTVLYVSLILSDYRCEHPLIKPMLTLWNIFLSIASSWGALRIVPWLGKDLMGAAGSEGLKSWTCVNGVEWCQNPDNSAQCFWLFVFCVSKIPEMIDTVFLVIRGRKVIFLHWYHHITVMWFCWLSWAHMAPIGRAFCFMNLTVHSFMYAYYALASHGLRPKAFASSITVMQISQMLVGCVLILYIFRRPNCHNHAIIQWTGILMYGSYLFLFVKFFITRNCTTRSSIAKKVN